MSCTVWSTYKHFHENICSSITFCLFSNRSAGRAEVSISFSCDFLLSGTIQTVHYTASKILTVVPDPPLSLGIPVTWVLPPSYTTSNLLPVTDSYGLDVHSHRKGVIYSVLRTSKSKKNSITIHGGKIMTRDINDLACIQGNDLSTERTEIASCVRVAQVSYFSIVSNDVFFHHIILSTQ